MPFVKLPLTANQILYSSLRDFSGHYSENQSLTKFGFLFERVKCSRKIMHITCQSDVLSQ